MRVLLQENDVVVHTFETKETEHSFVFDGDSELWLYVYRNPIDSDQEDTQWRLAWKGNYESTQKMYADVVTDTIISESGFHGTEEKENFLPHNEDQALEKINAIRKGKI